MPAALTNIAFEWTNSADWTVRFQANDNETGDLLDFTDAAISVAVKDRDGCGVLSASIGSGVTIISAGIFEIKFTEAQMATLCEGSYKIGAVYSLNGAVNQLFRGTLGIVDGVARA